MAQSQFEGPITAGTVWENASANIGKVILHQSVSISQTASGTTSKTIIVPASSRIVAIYADVAAAYNGSTSPLTVGTSAGGEQFAPSTTCQTAGRIAMTFTAAQLTLWANVTTNTSIIATMISTGTVTAGTVIVHVFYVQN